MQREQFFRIAFIGWSVWLVLQAIGFASDLPRHFSHLDRTEAVRLAFLFKGTILPEVVGLALIGLCCVLAKLLATKPAKGFAVGFAAASALVLVKFYVSRALLLMRYSSNFLDAEWARITSSFPDFLTWMAPLMLVLSSLFFTTKYFFWQREPAAPAPVVATPPPLPQDYVDEFLRRRQRRWRLLKSGLLVLACCLGAFVLVNLLLPVAPREHGVAHLEIQIQVLEENSGKPLPGVKVLLTRHGVQRGSTWTGNDGMATFNEEFTTVAKGSRLLSSEKPQMGGFYLSFEKLSYAPATKPLAEGATVRGKVISQKVTLQPQFKTGLKR